MAAPHFKPQHSAIKAYYDQLAGFRAHEVVHEGATSSAFLHSHEVATSCSRAASGPGTDPNGTLRDDFNLHRGYWEAKDSAGKLDANIFEKLKSISGTARQMASATVTNQFSGTRNTVDSRPVSQLDEFWYTSMAS